MLKNGKQSRHKPKNQNQMKKLILIAALTCSVTSAFARQIVIIIEGTRKEGTQTSVNYNADGSVTVSATCNSTFEQCAKATVEVGSRASDNPLPGDPTQFETYDEAGNVAFTGSGHFVSQQTVVNENDFNYELTLTNFVQQ